MSKLSNMPIVITFFLLGLSFGSGPCLAACGPLLISYIAGTGKKFKDSVVTYLIFSSARIVTLDGIIIGDESIINQIL